MAKTHQRVGALIIAVLFLVTSIAFSVVVIMQARSPKEPQSNQEDQASQGSLNQNQENENMLQGTKLANFTPVSEVNELQIIDIKEGDGEVVPEGATVTAHYTGALAMDGTIFQSSKDFGQPIPFSLNGVIEGWTKGVPGMKVGGIRRLIIPAAQAYGAQDQQGIPANSALVFDIELVKLGE